MIVFNYLVDVSVSLLAGGVTAEVARVLLGQVLDDDRVWAERVAGVVVHLGLDDRLPVVDPLELGRGHAPGLALEHDVLALRSGHALWRLDEVGRGLDAQLDRVRLGDTHAVGGLAGVVALQYNTIQYNTIQYNT